MQVIVSEITWHIRNYLQHERYMTRDEAKKSVFDYIEVF